LVEVRKGDVFDGSWLLIAVLVDPTGQEQVLPLAV